MADFQKAINYETFAKVLKKADSFIIPLFDTVASMCDVNKPLTENLSAYLSVLTVPQSLLVSAYDEVCASFENVMKMNDVRILDRTDRLFPKQAKNVPFLYLRGNEQLLGSMGLCVVGTRTPTEHGIKITREVVDCAGDMGLTIVSGLAKGIDGVAHIQALSKGFQTVGVIGTPIDQVYPNEHDKLQEYIAHRGLVVSMFAPSRQVQKYFFLMRDELMAAIGHGSFVCEADDGGGAVKQAKFTEQLGKNVYVLRETYENRTNIWPRSFKSPVVLSEANSLKFSFGRNTSETQEKKKITLADVQPSLF